MKKGEGDDNIEEYFKSPSNSSELFEGTKVRDLFVAQCKRNDSDSDIQKKLYMSVETL